VSMTSVTDRDLIDFVYAEARLLDLQRSHGNAFVQRLVQRRGRW